jgi:hypothetical protein
MVDQLTHAAKESAGFADKFFSGNALYQTIIDSAS